jgi:GDP-L-fucose synthase
VIPGLIYRFHNAKINKLESVTIWGTGKPKREFLYVDDMARASVYVMNLDRETYYKYTSLGLYHLNVGSGVELTIKKLADLVKKVVGYGGKINFDSSKPDGTFKKLLDSERLYNLGFRSKISLEEGLIKAYHAYTKF